MKKKQKVYLNRRISKSNVEEKKDKNNRTILTILASLSLSIFILSFSVITTLRMKWTYSIIFVDDSAASFYGYNLSEEVIKENYSNLIDYMFSPMGDKLEFKELPMSKEGEIHFYEVKQIFKNFNYLMYGSLITTIFLAVFLISKKNFNFLKFGSILVFIIPLILAIPVIIDFDYTFIKFHELAFSNDYWLFDPFLDPIILYLPQSLFMINTIIIMVLILLITILNIICYKRLTKASAD